MAAKGGKPEEDRLEGRRRGVVVKCPRLRGYNEVEFSDHALTQMKTRGLTQEQVLDAIRNPDVSSGLDTQPGRERFRQYLSKTRALDVIFEEHKKRIVVVTAMKASLRTKDRPS